MSLPANAPEDAASVGAGGAVPGGEPADVGFDVADLIGQASASLGALARRAGIALVCQVSSAPLRAQGERQRCLETLLELVGVAATPQAGGGELRITAALDGAYVEVAVTHVVSGSEHLVGALCLPRCRTDLDGDGHDPGHGAAGPDGRA
jgi:hypothetical protein